tara:strand:- start:951 stop:1313 length:363 start_codon:yes stop_codon:yes gene_type:complete
MTKVFYDGNCPICSREIKLYKKLNNNKVIEWYDVYSDKKALKIINKSKKDCIKRFHVIENNMVYKGVDAFFILWKSIRYFKILYYLFNFKIIKFILNILYNKYADYRYNKLYNKIGEKNE